MNDAVHTITMQASTGNCATDGCRLNAHAPAYI